MTNEAVTRMATGSQLGGGAFSSVYLTVDRGQHVAIKCNFRNRFDFMSSVREACILRMLRHPNIVRIQEIRSNTLLDIAGVPRQIGPCTDQPSWDVAHFVFPRIQFNLRSMLLEKRITPVYALKGIYQLLQALRYVHMRNICHRDLKTENVLITSEGDFQLCDCGISTWQCSQVGPMESAVTAFYRAPEIIISTNCSDTRIDIWSLGCLMVEMITGNYLFPLEKDLPEELVTKIISVFPCIYGQLFAIYQNQHLRNFQPNTVPYPTVVATLKATLRSYEAVWEQTLGKGMFERYLEVAAQCLTVDYRKRPTATQLLQHPLFAKFSETFAAYDQLCKTPPSPVLVFYNRLERRKLSTFVEDLQKQKDKPWYSVRALILTIDLYDRYLHNQAPQFQQNTVIHSLEDLEAIFYVLYYIALKLVFPYHLIPRFAEIVPECGDPSKMKRFEDYEFYLTGTIFRFHLYRPTLYEVYPNELTDDRLDKMLHLLLKISDKAEEGKNITLTLEDLLKGFSSIA